MRIGNTVLVSTGLKLFSQELLKISYIYSHLESGASGRYECLGYYLAKNVK